jgi:hypothetical protein
VDICGGSVEADEDMNFFILLGDVRRGSEEVEEGGALIDFFFFGILNLGGLLLASSDRDSAECPIIPPCVNTGSATLVFADILSGPSSSGMAGIIGVTKSFCGPSEGNGKD